MYRYKQIEYKAGATIEVIKCIPRGCRLGDGREPAPKKTLEEMRKANERQAARKLARKINANFKPGDWHMVLTYKRGNRPDAETAQKNITKFIKRLRREYRKCGYELKYIHATEYLKTAIHHHFIINEISNGEKTAISIARELWKDHGHIMLVPLYEDGEYRRLADYLIKETEQTFRQEETPFRQRYSCSRNLIIPKPEPKIRKVKKGWEMDPKPRPGYYIDQDSLYNGFDKLGYPYQRYVMVKIHPVDADWEQGRKGGRSGVSSRHMVKRKPK